MTFKSIEGDGIYEDFINSEAASIAADDGLRSAGLDGLWFSSQINGNKIVFRHVRRGEEVTIDNADLNRWHSYEKEAPGTLAARLRWELYS